MYSASSMQSFTGYTFAGWLWCTFDSKQSFSIQFQLLIFFLSLDGGTSGRKK